MEQAVKAAKARLSSVANAIRLLTSFSGEEDELGITTLAGRLRLAKSTVHRTAEGKVLLAHQPGDYVKEAIGRGLTAYTPKTITKREAVLAMLDEARLRGHAIDDEESEGGLRAIAAPVRNHNGAVIAALGVAAPVQRMNKKLMQTCVPSVIETADAVSARLGYLPSRSRADF